MSVRQGYDETRDETWPVVETISDEQEPEDLIGPDRLLRYLDSNEPADQDEDPDCSDRADYTVEDDETDDDRLLPRILSMPDGITVDERLVGRAVAQWILQVRCDCGRRWFEVEEVDTATCPRCGLLVYVDLDARSMRPTR